MKRLCIFLLCCQLMPMLLLSGCGDGGGSRSQGKELPSTPGISKAEVVRGPLSFRIKVSSETIRFDQRLQVTMEARAPEQYSFQFPPFGEGLQNQFGIVDYQTDTPVLGKDRTISYRRTYILDPIIDGKLKIPAVSAGFQDKGQDGKLHQLETEPFDLEVTMPPAEFWQKLDIDDQKHMTPAASLHPGRNRRILLGAGIALAVLAAVLAVVLAVLRHRRRHSPPPVIPAHLIALRELQQLLGEDLIGRNQLKEFYGRISGILRKYIENRFLVKAPELTTEEFLLQLTTAQTLLKQHQKLLTEFLKFCDMVKFAQHRPEEHDIQQTFDACKSFIAATQEAVES